jgi:hypothetical protein
LCNRVVLLHVRAYPGTTCSGRACEARASSHMGMPYCIGFPSDNEHGYKNQCAWNKFLNKTHQIAFENFEKQQTYELFLLSFFFFFFFILFYDITLASKRDQIHILTFHPFAYKGEVPFALKVT